MYQNMFFKLAMHAVSRAVNNAFERHLVKDSDVRPLPPCLRQRGTLQSSGHARVIRKSPIDEEEEEGGGCKKRNLTGLTEIGTVIDEQGNENILAHSFAVNVNFPARDFGGYLDVTGKIYW